MKQFTKIGSTIAILALIGASIGGYAAFAATNAPSATKAPSVSKQFQNGSGKGKHGNREMIGMQERGGHGGPGGKGGPGGRGNHGGRGDHGGPGGMLGGKGGGNVHQQKYTQLLVATYAADQKADWDTYFKAEKELQTQMDALRTSGKVIDHSKLPAKDQATIDAEKAAHDAVKSANDKLKTAIEADKATDIAAALKELLVAQKQHLTLKAKHLKELQAAATAPTSTSAPAATTTAL